MAKIAKLFDMQNSSNNRDRISDLPDPLLHYILSFLPSIHVVQSCSSKPVKPLLEALNSVESLELSQGFIWACAPIFIFEEVQQILECPFNNLKFLKLTTFFMNREVQVINTLLRFSPNIETFALKNGSPKECKNIPIENMGFDEHELSHLRLVKFQDFQGLHLQIVW